MSADAIRLDVADDVATALRALEVGETVMVSGPGGRVDVTPTEPVPAFHKVALHALAAGRPVRKYGAVIGEMTTAVAAGGLVHVHNLKSLKARDAGRLAPRRGDGSAT